MKKIISLISWLCGLLVSMPLPAQANSCNEYENVEVTYRFVNPHGMVFSLIDSLTSEIPHVDSLWITNAAFKTYPEVLFSSKQQSGDTIDLAPFVGTPEEYRCWLQIDECVKYFNFYFNGLEWDYCLDFNDNYIINISQPSARANTIYYYISRKSNENQGETPSIDGVWVVDTDYNVVLTTDALPGDPIDISPLDKGIYLLQIQMGDCVTGKTFFQMNEIEEGLEPTSSAISHVKILSDDQILILRGDKTFTVTGQEIIVP